MTARIHLLRCAAAFLLVHAYSAQLVPGYNQPIYNVPQYVNAGLNPYRQSQLAKAANGLALPVQQTQKLVSNVALPSLPSAQNVATNAGQPSLSPAQRIASSLSLPLTPKVFPASPLHIRSKDEQVNSGEERSNAAINPINEASDDELKEVVGSSGSFSNETTTDESHRPKPRSPDHNGGPDNLDYLSEAANPIEDAGKLLKKVEHGFQHTVQKIDHALWPSHAQQDAKETGDAKDSTPYKSGTQYNYNNENYNGVGGMIKNVGHGLQHTMQKIDHTLWPSHAQQMVSQRQNYENENDYQGQGRAEYPTDVMSRYYMQMLNSGKNMQGSQFDTDRTEDPSGMMKKFVQTINSGKNMQGSQSDSGTTDSPSDMMNKLMQMMNSAKNMQGPDLQNMASDTRNAMGEFLKSMSKSSQTPYEKFAQSFQRNNDEENDVNNQNLEQGTYKQPHPMDKLWKSATTLAEKFVGSMSQSEKDAKEADSSKAGKGQSESNQSNNPMGNFFNSASKFVDNLASAMSKTVESENQRNNPASKIGEKVSNLAGNMADAVKNAEKSVSKQFHDFSNAAAHNLGSQQGLNPNVEMWKSAVDMAEKIAQQHGINPAGDPNVGMWKSAIDLAGKFAQQHGMNPTGDQSQGFNSNAGNMAGKDAQFGMNPGYYNGNGQYFNPYSQGNGGGYNNQWGYPGGAIANAATNIAQGISGFGNGGGYYKNSNPSEASSSPLAQYPAGMFGPSGEARFFKRSPGGIFDSATGLAGSIVNTATNPGKADGAQILGSVGNIFNAAQNLAGDIGKVGNAGSGRMLGSSNPIGAIMNPASMLGSQITSMALNPAKIAGSPLLGAAGPIASIPNQAVHMAGKMIPNQAVNMAGKIVNTALNPGFSFGTYAGGYFPRNNPAGSIVDSATQLASQILYNAGKTGKVGAAPFLQPVSGIGNYAGMQPFGSIFNSASKLAGDISNAGKVF